VLAALVRWRCRVVPVVRWAVVAAAGVLSLESHDGAGGARRARRRGGGASRRGLGTHALTLATSLRPDSPLLRNSPAHRRRRSASRRAVLQRAAKPPPTRRSVYDELWF
jgi:hypothetical protein